MRRVTLIIAVSFLAAACTGASSGSSTSAAADSSDTTTSTIGAGTTSQGPTTATEPTTTAATTTTAVPGATPVEHTAYCVRGTNPSDALNVRSGPGTSYEVVGELAWNATDVLAGGLAAPDEGGRLWYQVGYNGSTGWAAGWHLEPAPCAVASASPAPLAGPDLPPALSGGLVPWTWVDEDWVLVLYAATWDGARILYLLGPYGDTYELFVWPTSAIRPFDLQDWRPDGRAALVEVGLGLTSDREIQLVDLPARTATTVLSVPFASYGGPATFTRPTGRDIVYSTGDAATEIVEVRYTDGSLFSTLLTHPRSADWRRPATWLYGLEGTTAVVGTGSELQLLTNHGDLVRALDGPGIACEPVRWWDASTVLTRCLAPEVLSYQPDGYYRRLWLVPVDGSAATALTALPTDPLDIVDFGYSEAWSTSGRVFAQWTGDCGAAGIVEVAADGSTTGLTGQLLIGLRQGNLVVRRWDACDMSPGSLHLTDLDGSTLETLVDAPADGPGVIDGLMLRDLP